MRRFKIFLWIFLVILIQTTAVSHIHILGAVPSVVISYMICVAILENEFRSAFIINIICAAAMGALSGREFVTTALTYAYSSILVFTLRKKPVYVGNFFKAVVWTFIVSVFVEVVYFAVMTWTVNTDMLLYDALPTAILNVAGALLIYPILKRTMYKEEKKKLLI